jgi:hypothetical protein
MSLLLESSGLLEPLQQLKGTRIPIRVLSWHSAPLPVNIRRWPSLSCTSGSAVSWPRSYTAPYWQVVRAKAVLMAAAGVANNEVGPVLAGPGCSALRWPSRSKPWPASSRRRQGCHCPVGGAPSWLVSWCSEGWWRSYRRRPFGASCAKTPSTGGSTGHGSSPATRASPSKRHACSRYFEGRALGDKEFVVCADEKVLKGTRIPIRALSWHSAPLPVNIGWWPSLSCTSGSAASLRSSSHASARA